VIYSMSFIPSMQRDFQQSPEWEMSHKLIEYQAAVQKMEAIVEDIIAGNRTEHIWLLEHPPIYTLGSSARETDVLQAGAIPAVKTGRGGQVTYHGPGQRIGYLMLDLRERVKDLRAYIWHLEEWLIIALKRLGVVAERRDGRVGLWITEKNGKENKIAAIGVRVRKWVAFHGFALNVHPDLSHYNGIVPCGIQQHGVTSLKAQGITVSLEEMDEILKTTFYAVF